MRTRINPVLLRMQLSQLFASRQGLAQFVFIQFILWFSSHGQAKDLFPGSTDYWSSYILIRGFCLALLLNAVVAGELFVQPKTSKTIEMLLASSLSPRSIAWTSVAASLIYNAVSLLFCFMVMAVSLDRLTFGWVHLLSFSNLMLADFAALVLTGFFALQTKYGSQIASLLILISVMLLFGTSFFQYKGVFAPAFQLGLGAGLLALSLLVLRLFGRFDKEKILLS